MIHLGLFWALSHWQHQVHLPKESKKKPIMAKLMFLPKPQKKPDSKPEPQPTPQPEKTQQAKPKERQKPQDAKQHQQPQSKAEPKPEKMTPPPANEIEDETLLQALPKATTRSNPRAVFNPRSGFKSLIADQDKAFLDGIEMAQPPPPEIKSINAYDDPAVKPLFDTQAQLSPEARVINYNGSCVMIERALDHNGFSYHKWSGYSGGCGIENKMLKQLKLSLEKHVKKKR